MGIFSNKKSKIKAAIPSIRESLRLDRMLLLAAIAGAIKKHWHVLDDKFEQCLDEDDYGNLYLQSSIKEDFIYFSHKVILPALQQLVDDGKTTNKDVAFILSDTIKLVDVMPSDITLQDTDDGIAHKLQLTIDGSSLLEDENLYKLSTDSGMMSYYVNQVRAVYIDDESITLDFGDQLRASQPIMVSPLVALIFKMFSIMYNNKPVHLRHGSAVAIENFTGNDPYKYEEYIKQLLKKAGFNAKRTKGSGDFGVDVLASKEGVSFAIQAKLYNHTVGAKAVQEVVSGRLFYKTNFGVVVSDNKFTDAAKTLARRSNIVLAHHKGLITKLNGLVHLSNGRVAGPMANNDVPSTPKNQWDADDTDELISVVLPTITNNK